MAEITKPAQLARYIDHTILKSTATHEQVIQLCREAGENGSAAVCVNAGYTGLVAGELIGSGVETWVVVGFPPGAGTPVAKAAETAQAVALGAAASLSIIGRA